MEHTLNCLPRNAAQTRYLRRFVCSMTLYIAAICAAVYYLTRHPTAGLLLYSLAILPALPILGMIGALGFYLAEEQDEFQRTILIQSILWATGLTFATLTIWGFLQNFANAVAFPTYLAFALFWVFLAIAGPFIKRRYR